MNKVLGIMEIIIMVTSVILSLKYDYSFVDNIILSITLVAITISFRYINEIKDSFHLLYVILYLFCSIHIVALFDLSSTGFCKDVILPNEYRELAIWGNHLFFIIFIVSSLFFTINKKRRYKDNIEKGTNRNSGNVVERLFIACTIFTFFLSFISITFGISSMIGEASIVLPFRLNGIIDELRSNTYPFMFAIYLYDCLKKGRSVNKRLFMCFLLYAILETILRASKSALVWSFLPALLAFVITGKVSRKWIVKYVLPLFVIGLMIYPIVEQVRRIGSMSMSSIKEAIVDVRTSDKEEKSSPYIRAFLTGVYYTKTWDHVDSDQFSFDFRNVPTLLVMGGGVGYMTFVIDGFSESDYQSSGITGLCDALLWGGYPLCYIMMLLITLFALYCDGGKVFKKCPVYKIISFFFLYILLVGRTISIFFDPLTLAVIGGIFIKVLVTRYYYRKLY